MALNYPVAMPTHLLRFSLGALETRANGGTPSSPDTFIAVATALVKECFTEFGLDVNAKTQCGSAIVSLGARINIPHRLIDVTDAKCHGMLLAIGKLETMVRVRQPLDPDMIETLTGRLANISDIYASLLEWLHAGYSVARARRRSRDGRRLLGPQSITLADGGRREAEMLSLLASARDVLERNEGSPAAPAAWFPHRSTPSTITFASDASGNDGVGGFAFTPDVPNCVFVVSDRWPEGVLEALAAAARPRAERAGDTTRPDMLSVPTAEGFGQFGVPFTVARHLGLDPVAVTAIGDCQPIARAVGAASSASPQLRVLLRAMRRLCEQWLGVHVPRDLNTDCDRLSHPSQVHLVVAAAHAADLQVVELPFHEDCWPLLRDAAAQAMAVEEKRGARILARVVRLRRGHQPPDGFQPVDVRRPGALGNPFPLPSPAAPRLQDGVGSDLDAVCDAHCVTAALSGQRTTLTGVATRFGLPASAIAQPYAAMAWEEYARKVKAALLGLQARLHGVGGTPERLALSCSCPLSARCHRDFLVCLLLRDADVGL